jgi:endonuclease/exonuclease/phosphatase family metal-dependent hydrolase
VLGCGPESSDDQVVIFDHNVQYRAGRAPDIAAQVVAAGADVLVLQEVWPALMAELEADPALAEHRYRASEALDATTGLALWSRWPLPDATLGRPGGRPILRAEVDSPHGRFTVHAVHTSAPVGTALSAAWRTELAELATYGTATPTVLAGDFNATADHRQFRAVLDQGWTDVHRPKGCGFDATWPEGRAVPPVSLLRLDHVLVTEHVEVLATEIGPASGSDHRSVTATIRLAQGP